MLVTHFNPKIAVTSGFLYKFQHGFCNECYYGECVQHSNVKIGDHNGIWPITKKKVKPKQ